MSVDFAIVEGGGHQSLQRVHLEVWLELEMDRGSEEHMNAQFHQIETEIISTLGMRLRLLAGILGGFLSPGREARPPLIFSTAMSLTRIERNRQEEMPMTTT